MSKIIFTLKKHPLFAYFTLVFVISWGSILLAYGPGVFLGTTEVSFVGGSPFAYLGYLAGPSVAGTLMTLIVYGKAGLHTFRSHLGNWRVDIRWYVIVLFTAPVLMLAILIGLSQISPDFLPVIMTTNNKAGVLVPGILVGLVVPFFEEIGWTGFAIPQLRQRFGILSTGVIMGVLWGTWHFPLFAGSANASGVVPPVLYELILLYSWLIPYRILMVWVYDKTKSLPVVMLMHMPIVVDQFVLRPENISGMALSIQLLLYGGLLWVLVVISLRRQSRSKLNERLFPIEG